jgi:hypothetical protein
MNSLLVSQNRVIFGDKGIGKSFTYLLYSYLSSFIIEARMQKHNKLKKYKLYNELLRKDHIFYKVKKLFYLPIKAVDSYSDFLYFLKLQITE